MSKEKMAAMAFFGYVLLTAFRDIGIEVWIFGEDKAVWASEEGKIYRLWITFITCTIILLLSIMYVLVRRQFGIIKKLRVPGAISRAIKLGLSCSLIYIGIFYLIYRLGAGLHGILDYGIGPLAMTIVGVIMFKEKITSSFIVAFLVCVIGVIILMLTIGDFRDWWLLPVAILVPVLSAVSDGWKKWLLNEAEFTNAEVLLIRFLPAVPLLYVFSALTSGSIVPQVYNPSKVLPATIIIAVFGAWLPLMLLCTGLGKAGMKKLAMWEFLIPVITFFGTLHLHPAYLETKYPILGAVFVLAGIVISEFKIFSRFGGGGSTNVIDGNVMTPALESGDSKGNANQMLEFLQNNRLPAESRPSEEEIEAQIEENRNSWD